jgi:HaeII restriction endonuclease
VRVRGIVKESDLVKWYEKCLRGKFSEKLSTPLLERLLNGFEAEFPFSTTLTDFLKSRGYDNWSFLKIGKSNFLFLHCILINRSAFHHEFDVFQNFYILQRIVGDGDDVSVFSCRNRADFIVPAQ